ncbi:MAG: hypothetical protein BRD49_04415 [Bacteroidetes bacterium SW_10_40_5]|nr:MAG: hypothetical protein BRD49_04415 [Bacteroidetes bacterium SW_10_40_5]
MIEAKPTCWGHKLITFYTNLSIKRHFSGLYVNQNPTLNPDKSVLLIGNHFSWWDGFVPYYVNKQVFKRYFYIMMLEEELTSRRLLRNAGAFSIKKQSRDAINSINYAASVLQQPQNLLVFYPEGSIGSMHQEQLHFQPGLERIVRKSQATAQALLVVMLVDYYAHPKPQIYFYMQHLEHIPDSAEAIEAHYNKFYWDAKAQQRNHNLPSIKIG